MKTLLEVLNLSTEYLSQHKIDHPRREAELLIADALGVTRMEIYLQHDRPVVEEELALLRGRLKRRSLSEPLQYIHGSMDFYKCRFGVTPAVLIPRQETEILVDIIVKSLENQDLKKKRLLDLCTGSGCIGISLKKQFPELDVTLADISEDALRVAVNNAEKNQVQISIVQGDLFHPLAGQKFDFIVCNPPYISEEEYATLDHEVKGHEPKGALVGGLTGLEFYRRIENELASFVLSQGKVWLEIGSAQGAPLLELFSRWPNLELLKDWAGHDRFLSFSAP